MEALWLTVLIINILKVFSQDFDYYWRDYNGKVPSDAVPAGEDVNGEPTFVGQIYLQGHGLFVAQIIPPNLQVEFAAYGHRKQDYAIKILCSKNIDKFSWLRTTWTSFHVDTIGKHPVVGGYDHVGNKGVVNIGRAMHQGILKIGFIASYQVHNTFFYFVHKNRMEKVKTFEVLLYNKA